MRGARAVVVGVLLLGGPARAVLADGAQPPAKAGEPTVSPAASAPPAGRWSWRRVPVWREVEVPVCERREVPARALRFVPRYEVDVEPVYGVRRVPVVRRETDAVTGTVREVVCGVREERVVVRERRHRRLVGYEPEEIGIGCRWETVEVRKETRRILAGWRWERVAVASVAP